MMSLPLNIGIKLFTVVYSNNIFNNTKRNSFLHNIYYSNNRRFRGKTLSAKIAEYFCDGLRGHI